MKVPCAVLCVGLLAVPACGQLIGKVPPATPPTPEYVPPAPPAATPPPKPPEPELPTPAMAVKEADGKIRKYPQGVERAAIELFPFDDAARRKIADTEAKRNGELERLVLDRLDKVLEARAALKTIDQVKGINEFDKAKQVATPLQVEKLSDRLMRDGAITPSQHRKIEQMVKEYEAAMGEEIRADPNFDVQKIFGAVARTSFIKSTQDVLGAMDRLAACGVGKLDASAGELKLSDEQRSKLGKGADPDAMLTSLSVEQLKTLLGKCAPAAAAQ